MAEADYLPTDEDAETADGLADLTSGTYRRGGEEFSRFLGFSDGVFGFAMTLLISTVVIPAVRIENLGEELTNEIPDLISFFVTFVVIGHYWLAHHRMFAAVNSVSIRVMRLNLVYMALIAFMPFPTALFGRYTDAPITVIIYSAALALASVIQALMFRELRSDGSLRMSLSDQEYRSVAIAILIPAAIFAVSAVVALFAAPWAPSIWILIVPAEWLVGRRSSNATRIFG